MLLFSASQSLQEKLFPPTGNPVLLTRVLLLGEPHVKLRGINWISPSTPPNLGEFLSYSA